MKAARENWIAGAKNASLAGSESGTFHSFFDKASDGHDAMSKGVIDFFFRIFTREMCEMLGEDPAGCSCLEIGYGGGRLLSAAASVFGRAYGIDVHDSEKVVESFLTKRGVSNATLINLNSADLERKISDASIAYAYSFIVFQHFDSVDDVAFYAKLLSRKMKRAGVATIYMSELENQKDDVIYDAAALQRDPRARTLYVRSGAAEALWREHGFHVVKSEAAGPKKIWLPNGGKSSQYVLTLQK